MNSIDLSGRTAIVTGGARGIGRAVVERFLSSGAACAIWDTDAAALQEAERELSGRGQVRVQQVDVAREEEVDAAVRGLGEEWAKVDILVNNAGIAGVSKKLWECSSEEWRQVVEVDLVAVFLCCRAVVPGMMQAGYGRIVNVASIAGKEGNPNASHYSAAKAGVIGLTKSLGRELAETGVLVNCIAPAVIETDILKQVSQQHIDYMRGKIPMNRFGTTTEAAALVAWLASEECSFSTGAVYDLSGGRATY